MNLILLESPHWRDYELLDTGNGLKLERFGSYRFVRPEVQAIWQPALPEADWRDADAVFRPTSEESGGHWDARKKLRERWEMRYPLPGAAPLKMWAMTTPGRHLGVFPECAAHWDWMAEKIIVSNRPARVLNLFGYTGLASLAAAAVGATVTHVDASKKSVGWARENQDISGLADKPIRWIVDDALKFVQREARRGAQYDGIYLDPPKFGRGPKGEIWEVYQSLPALLEACRAILSPNPLFVALTMYAVKASGVHLHATLDEMMRPYKGSTEAGELVTRETSAGRLVSQAVFGRWSAT
ncbi:MAG TPA: SAM-dependent methyltransferase [Anaerolineae bacterium]|jgi:23S rRNA (cytosine1962-C5)-methyltransferase|nr:SAM-dependent methyltransferase [Anaerolineae bacterium]